MSQFLPEVETYLASTPEKYREPLRKVANHLHQELKIDPVVSYGIIGFILNGKYGIYISGWKDHMSFHGGHYLPALAESHPEWFKAKGATIWFQAEPELPIGVIKAVIQARLESMPEEKIPPHLIGWNPAK